MTKSVSFSHSSLKEFEQCPRKYHETKVLKLHPYTQTEAAKYGDLLHKACEAYVLHGESFPKEYEFVQPVVDALIARPGRKLPEYKMALTKDLKPCGWKDWDNCWVRGMADLLIVDDDNLMAWVADYKTGNNKYPERDQLTLMSLLVFEHFPHIRKVHSALIFVVKNDFIRQSMLREDKDAHWWKYRERVAKIEACHAAGTWNPRSSPLCGWCPCTGCEFHPKH